MYQLISIYIIEFKLHLEMFYKTRLYRIKIKLLYIVIHPNTINWVEGAARRYNTF